MTSEQRCLEVDTILLLIALHDVVVLDVAHAEASSHTDDRVVLGASALRLVCEGFHLILHRDAIVDEDVLLSFSIGSNIQGNCLPAGLTEAANHGFAKGAVSTDDQTRASSLH